MLSDAIRESREQFRTATPALKEAVRQVLPGFDTDLHLWEVTARDLEGRIAFLDELARPADFAEPLIAPPEERPAKTACHGIPELARRLTSGGAK